MGWGMSRPRKIRDLPNLPKTAYFLVVKNFKFVKLGTLKTMRRIVYNA